MDGVEGKGLLLGLSITRNYGDQHPASNPFRVKFVFERETIAFDVDEHEDMGLPFVPIDGVDPVVDEATWKEALADNGGNVCEAFLALVEVATEWVEKSDQADEDVLKAYDLCLLRARLADPEIKLTQTEVRCARLFPQD